MAWYTAKKLLQCLKAAKYACPCLFRCHDLRRSAVRNIMPSGVQRAVATEISGHSTPHIFQRYNRIAESDLREVVEKVEEPSLTNCSEVVQLVAQRTLTPLILVRVQASEPNSL